MLEACIIKVHRVYRAFHFHANSFPKVLWMMFVLLHSSMDFFYRMTENFHLMEIYKSRMSDKNYFYKEKDYFKKEGKRKWSLTLP